MSEYDRRIAIIEQLCRFCPICRAELVTQQEPVKARQGNLSKLMDVTRCPDGHGIVSAGMGDGNVGPCFLFELDEAIFS